MKFFLSYSRADKEYASQLAAEITTTTGAEIWRDEDVSGFGAEFPDALRKAIVNSEALILVLPREGASGANNAFFEAGAAKALGKKVLAVVRGGADRVLPSHIVDLAILNADAQPI